MSASILTLNSRRWDWRTRRDRKKLLNEGFENQMSEMVHGYMRWCASQEDPDRTPRGTGPPELYKITVVDLFRIVPALIIEGFIPCAPHSPHVAITVRVLEIYRVAHARCPHLVIQAFVKTLCDFHGKLVLQSLGRDSFSWRLKHVWTPCMYKLEGEEKLIFDILVTMDGNNSLKRILRREKIESDGDTGEGDDFVLGKSKEHSDDRDAGDGYYLDRERVNEWSKQRIVEMLPVEAVKGHDESNPCAERWKNMVEDITANMWGIFDETGIFVCLCCHGFVLMIVDMIKSGELSKYPLAVTDTLIEHLGKDIGARYDVRCEFQTTIRNSPLAARAVQCNFQCLVGAFHGHAHNRLCQLCMLATYVLGLGCEDLEGAESFFSGSNGLAKSCRYASRFHRQQEITSYVKHYDGFHTYANLSKFIDGNHKQALGLLKKEETLRRWMVEEQIGNDYNVFRGWLEEEKKYLLGLKTGSKDQTETLEMEYVQKLVNLDATRYVVLAAEAKNAQKDNAPYRPGVSKEERTRRHAKEKVDHDLKTVKELEEKLDITDRWTVDSPQWASTVQQVKQSKYQKALDAVELLVVERIFELTKMNLSQTGPKARSKAVQNAIDRYNAAALALDPPMNSLTWEQVVEYTFLADFDILRDTRAKIQSRPWTWDSSCALAGPPSYRLAMDTYFKIERAQEEITRLNIEIRRMVTWIRDEGSTLRSGSGKSLEQAESDWLLGVQMKLYREQRGRFDDDHMNRFQKLSKMKGFTGRISPGRAGVLRWM
ncbi:hypothetical protein K438DRAFT_1907889 [Mycena galopus ATCC 62051]|nr:hypothetical protein K438DRAFT_1907889 [Mycena galopus ATCC 62051]